MAAEPSYNPIFTRFVELERDPDEQVQGLVAYGLYKVAKREWVREHFAAEGRKPTDEELAAYARTWTNSRLDGLMDQAQGAMAQFAAAVVEQNAPAIREEALRGTRIGAIGLNMAAAALYSFVLLAVVLVASWFGVDLIGLFQKARPHG